MRARSWKSFGRYLTLATTLAVCMAAGAQVTVQKNGVDVPEDRVHVLYNTALRVVAQEFHLKDAAEIRFPVTLVLGDANERVMGDELNKVYVIYMERWDEAKFALAASRIVIQRLVSEERKTKIVADILRCANQIAPISLQALNLRR